MSINLQKGQKINLTKGDSGGLRQVMVGLGWDEAPRAQGGGFLGSLFGSQPAAIDCDASAILCGTNGRLADPNNINNSVVYFGNLRHPSGAIVHQGDNLTGAGDGDDSRLWLIFLRFHHMLIKLYLLLICIKQEREDSILE